MSTANVIVDKLSVAPTETELTAIFDEKYRRNSILGPGPRLRLQFGYFTPDDYYECLVNKLVKTGDRWADVGCGRDIFLSNAALAEVLSRRCKHLLGIDPDPNIRDNPFIHEGFEGVVEDYQGPSAFDVVTLRMVAEHIVNPSRAMAKISELLRPGGMAVIYTPNKWSPIPIITSLVPNRYHHRLKRLIWDVDERDTFPTAFKLNTQTDLKRECNQQGLSEIYFAHLDDCRTSGRYLVINRLELSIQRFLHSFRITYPENNLLGIYQKRL